MAHETVGDEVWTQVEPWFNEVFDKLTEGERHAFFNGHHAVYATAPETLRDISDDYIEYGSGIQNLNDVYEAVASTIVYGHIHPDALPDNDEVQAILDEIKAR